ncbi:hypothetical protein CR511_16900 [Pseudomonas putida]|jgi:DNA-binding CsgD family transcriptional regulator|nr:hypothetical protein CR511_16900 [Pseudomonas putida]
MRLNNLLSNPEILPWHEQVADLYDHSSDQDLPTRISEWLKEVVCHEAFILKLYDTGSELPIIISHDIPQSRHEAYFERYLADAYRYDPLLLHLGMQGGSKVVQINSETCALKGSDYYSSYYRGLALRDEVDFVVPLTDGASLVLSIGRKGSVASREEIHMLENVYAIIKGVLGNYYKHSLDKGRSAVVRQGTAIGEVGATLTAREREIVDLMISGRCTKDLARYLGISVQTVKVHRRNIYSKLGINTELQLCSLFLARSSPARGTELLTLN